MSSRLRDPSNVGPPIPASTAVGTWAAGRTLSVGSTDVPGRLLLGAVDSVGRTDVVTSVVDSVGEVVMTVVSVVSEGEVDSVGDTDVCVVVVVFPVVVVVLPVVVVDSVGEVVTPATQPLASRPDRPRFCPGKRIVVIPPMVWLMTGMMSSACLAWPRPLMI